MINDSQERYGRISRIFHWGMALLIVWQLLKLFDRIDDGEHWIGQALVPWHVSIGTLLLLLVVFRIIWAGKQKHNRPKQNPATATLVRIGHFSLYAAMALLPITGILTMIGNGYGWSAFGTQLVAKGDEIAWMASLGGLHSPTAWLLLIMIIAHIGIALAHHFIKKDDVLSRMA